MSEINKICLEGLNEDQKAKYWEYLEEGYKPIEKTNNGSVILEDLHCNYRKIAIINTRNVRTG